MLVAPGDQVSWIVENPPTGLNELWPEPKRAPVLERLHSYTREGRGVLGPQQG